jgi:SAM-dependent methyltransferase
VTTWSDRAQAYRESPTHRKGVDLDLLVEWCEPAVGVKALDVATGGGHVARRLRGRGCAVVSLDPSPGMHADVLARAEDIPFEDGSFDVVVAGELLEHLRDPRRVVSEVLRVLRPGGTFVASVPNAYRLKNRLRFLLGRNPEDDPTHLQMFAPHDLRTLLAGFEDVHLHLIAGRLVPLHARLFANDIVFSGRKSR